MTTSHRREEYVATALTQGVPRAEVAAALLAAGWSESDVADSLARWAEGPRGIPVPTAVARAGGTGLGGVEALALVLVFAAILGALVWLGVPVIAALLPDAADYSGVEFLRDTIRWQIAALVVAVPLFLWLDRRVQTGAEGHAGRETRGVLGNIVLFLAGVCLIGDAVYVLYKFLSGELTLRFLLQAVLIAAVAGLAFAYLRGIGGGAARDRLAVRALIGLTLLLVALGLWVVGGPGQGRSEMRDAARLADLRDLIDQAQCLYTTEGEIPEAVGPDDACSYAFNFDDRFTGEPYRYARLSDTMVQACAVFEDPEAVQTYDNFNPATGCLIRALRKP